MNSNLGTASSSDLNLFFDNPKKNKTSNDILRIFQINLFNIINSRGQLLL